MQNETQHIIDTIVIGAGLTGLTTAHTLRKHGKEVVVLEKTTKLSNGGYGKVKSFMPYHLT